MTRAEMSMSTRTQSGEMLMRPRLPIMDQVSGGVFLISGWDLYALNRRRRRLLVTTVTLEEAIAAAANIGLRNPSAARGIIAVL